MKKQLLTVLLALICVSGFAQTAVWIEQNSGFVPVSSGVRYVSTVDSNIVWICAYDGSGGGANRQDFSRTIDGGLTWTSGTIPVPASYDWSMIHGVSADTAFAVFYDANATTGGGIWRTVDGGATWTQCGVGTMYVTGASFPNVVHFWNNLEGWAMGDPLGGYYELYTTNDGGNTWTRTPQANIPAPLSGEYGIVGHYNVIGDNVWFDTQKGRVYRSHDRGQTWQVSATGITVPTNGAIDIAFYSETNGIARLYSAAGVNTVRTTSDSGATWAPLTVTGNFWGSDVQYVPGTASKLVSTGAATGLTGSSYSDDGGATWVDIETGTQRTALGVYDSTHMWTGGFTVSPTQGGIYKYTIIAPVTCGDANISPGITAATDTFLCEGDTTIITATGVYAPTVGDFAGVSWIISNADITGVSDPLNDPSLVTTYTFAFPAPTTFGVAFINDNAFIGSLTPYGVYYWTPVVFGNATGSAPQFLQDLILDPLCTYTGTSIAIEVLPPGDPLCSTSGINSLNSELANLSVSQVSENTMNLRFTAERSGKLSVEIVDITGRNVFSSENLIAAKGINNTQLNVVLPAGTYVVKTEINGVVATAKFVKQ